MKFNFLRKHTTAATTANYEGEKAFALTPELELYMAVAMAALSDNFYEKSVDRLQRLRELIEKNNAEFVAKLAVYAREKMYLRSIPMVLAVELAKQHNGDDLIQSLTTRIVQRADEITELLSYYALANERTSVKQLNKLSKQIQKGLSVAFNRFDEYQFAKYNRDTNIKLRDALFLVHPKAKDEVQQALFNKIAKDELQTPYTWEVDNLTQIFHDPAITSEFDLWVELEIYGYQGAAVTEIPGCAGRNDVFRGSLEFVSTNDLSISTGANFFKPLSFKYELKNYTLNGTDVLGETTKTFSFTLDEAVPNAKFYLITSNHGSNSGGEEYIR
ncbi:MAG: TROVE domain-containing protein, partial [Sphingobacteriaceae bacterium]